MNQIFTRILISALLILIIDKTSLFGQINQPADGITVQKDIGKKNNIDDSRNRFPEILHDVKILLSEVLIADHHLDTLEVIYNLSRIYDLLMEADQIGDMNQEDQEDL